MAANTLNFVYAGLVDGDLPDSVDEDAVAIAREADSCQYQPVERLSETFARVNPSVRLDRRLFVRRAVGQQHQQQQTKSFIFFFDS